MSHRVRSALAAHRDELVAATAVYAGTFLLGFVAYVAFGTRVDVAGYESSVASASAAAGVGQFTFLHILGNNAVVVGVSAAGGLALGVPTLVNTLFNGFVMGVLGGVVATAASPDVALAAVLPHVIVEVPAFLLAAAAGFKLPRALGSYLVGNTEYILDRRTVRDSAVVAVTAVALVVVAAVVEVVITPWVVNLVVS
ncbi:stage II sporulation protein M [Halapricum desulfuricans]|uniref:Putative membrane protein, a component ofa putative membrane remodelling system n=1 Tax=Halapricum desulfuricans TaxID=2841257 RepID=A0A897NS51_9EURY|nr:stage II sporulation protein M [Halapricum desulfuricans]QSG13629.1 putative membrane protein, a component ofa putative membrane remodelling system [Halapricum desulfuricans]